MDSIIKGLNVYTESGIEKNGSIGINNGKIVAPSFSDNAQNTYEFPSNYHLIPGMIDMHIHGANGADVMDGDIASLQTICQALPSEGTTSYLATTMSEPISNINNALKNTADFIHSDYTGAEIIGIHLEGPFISKKRLGAQREACVIKPDIELFKQWQTTSRNLIKQVTIAPEEDSDFLLTTYLVANNIIASLGHSDADYQQACAAIDAGCSHATHLFNAMRSLKHREPGAITALLNATNVTVELIVDGVHLDPAIVELTYNIKSKNNIVLITDAMRAKCCCDGKYNLGGQEVIVSGNQARLQSGALAGSVLQMKHAITNMMKFTNCNLSDIVTMTAINPAKLLTIFDRKGSIKINKDADLVVLDDKYNVVATFCRGHLSYHA